MLPIFIVNRAQTGMAESFRSEEFYFAIDEQTQLLQHFAHDDRVFFIDVNMHEFGPTLSHSLKILKQKETYKLLIKDKFNAFDNMTFVNEASQDIINTPLDHYLQSIDVNHIHVVGGLDEHCVKETAEYGLKQNYSVSVDSDMNILPRSEDSGQTRKAANNDHWRELEEQYPNLHRTQLSYFPCSS